MSKATQWALLALGMANVAVLLPVLIPQANHIIAGLILGGGIAHALHGWYGCSFFPDSEVDRREGREEASR